MIKRYPAIEFVAQHGRRLALVAGIGALVAAVASFFLGGTAGSLAAGVIGAIVLYGLLRIGAELVEVIAETLLPR